MNIAIDFKRGLGFLAAGFALLLRRPKLILLGMLPPLLVSGLALAALILLALFGLAPITDLLVAWLPPVVQTAARIVLGVLIMAVAVVVIVVLFASVTLAIGAPIYEKISQQVERELGEPVFATTETAARSAIRGIVQSVGTVALSVLGAIVVFIIGLIPIIGGPLAVVTGAILGGFLLAAELISGPFDRWGRTQMREKFAAINSHRSLSLGFGIPVFLIFSIPILSVLFFPAATAGATILAVDLKSNGPVVVEG